MAAADAYYRDALMSVDRRRATATSERGAVLDAQREAIDVERSRRLAEIEATFTARHELRPFRAHLVFVPALQVPVDVRRGSRVYPFTLTWHLGAGAFAGLRCPHCRATEPLVAGRHHLGCRACLPPPPLAAPAPAPPPRPPTSTAGPAAARTAGPPTSSAGPAAARTGRPARPRGTASPAIGRRPGGVV